MEFAALARGVEAVPIKDAVGGVGVLLDFKQDNAGAQGVDAAAGKEHGVAGFDRDAMETVGDGLVGEVFEEFVACDTVFEADKEFGAGIGVGDVPHFSFWFTTEFGGAMSGRMDLKGEFFPGIEDFNEEREAGLSGMGVAEEIAGVMFHEPAEAAAGQVAVGNDAFVAGTVADFPGFARRQFSNPPRNPLSSTVR